MIYHVYLEVMDRTIKFTFKDYDSVQNLIGYMVEGNPFVKFTVAWEGK